MTAEPDPVEAICDPAFALVGVSGTTDAVAPLLIVNGPVRAALDVNSGAGAFGPGWRANATIGRAVPGEISMSTFSQTGRYSYCIGENEEASPWEPLHVEPRPQAGLAELTVPHGMRCAPLLRLKDGRHGGAHENQWVRSGSHGWRWQILGQ